MNECTGPLSRTMLQWWGRSPSHKVRLHRKESGLSPKQLMNATPPVRDPRYRVFTKLGWRLVAGEFDYQVTGWQMIVQDPSHEERASESARRPEAPEHTEKE